MSGVLRIVTEDAYLGQKLRLELSALFVRIEVSAAEEGAADVYIFDTRTHAPRTDAPTHYYLSESGDTPAPSRTLPLPLPIGLAAKRLGQRRASPLTLSADGRTVHFLGKEIRLTEVEFSLLTALYAAKGAYISRESLHAAVWGEAGTSGLLNVYIHYLREKLETEGERVILSSRKLGYALSEKYAGEEEEC